MDKKQLLDEFKANRVGKIDLPYSAFKDEDLERLATIIAAQHEAEIQEAETKWDLHMVGQQERIEGLEARVAVMSEALADIKRSWWDKYYPPDIFDGSSGDEGALEVVRIRAMLDEALSAAPKAEARLLMQLAKVPGGERVLVGTGQETWLSLGALEFEQVYDVLVLAREQGQDSEQEG